MSSKVKTIADFRAAHDKNVIVPTKIKAALDSMAKEHPESWLYEQELLKRAGLCTTDLAMFRDQFQDYIVETSGRVSKRVWFASIASANKIKRA